MVDIAHEQAVLRRAAILKLLYQVWPKVLGAGLIGEALPADLKCPEPALKRDLLYLCEHGQISASGTASQSGSPIFVLTADGLDAVESASVDDVARARHNRLLRLRVLQSLSWAGPGQPMGYALIGRSLAEDTDLDLSEMSIRRAMAYLVARHLAAPETGELHRITADGLDYLAGEGDGIAGVARPQGW